jgi:hypothetical protein
MQLRDAIFDASFFAVFLGVSALFIHPCIHLLVCLSVVLRV